MLDWSISPSRGLQCSVAFAALLIVACEQESPPVSADDSGGDLPHDSGALTGLDAGDDAPTNLPDAGHSDAGVEDSPDSGSDAAIAADAGAGIDAGAGPDSGVDASNGVPDATTAPDATAGDGAPYIIQGEVPAGFQVNWPIAPNISRTVRVTTSEELQREAAVNGTRVIVADGTYSPLGLGSASNTDVLIEAENPGQVRIESVTFHGRRLIVRGLVISGHLDVSHGPHDVLVDNCSFTFERPPDAGWVAMMVGGTRAGGPYFHRIAIIHTTFEWGGEVGNSFGILTWEGASEGAQSTDFIIAGCYFHAEDGLGTAMHRMGHVTNMIYVDNYLRNENTGGGQIFRMHNRMQNVLFTNNTWDDCTLRLDQYGDGVGAGGAPDNVYLIGETQYLTSAQDAVYNDFGEYGRQVGQNGPASNLRAQDITIFSENQGGIRALHSGDFSQSVMLLGNNTTNPFQTPPGRGLAGASF